MAVKQKTWVELNEGPQKFRRRADEVKKRQKVYIPSSDIPRAPETDYRAIFDAANDAIFVHDLKTGRILDVNHKMSEMYGYEVEEAKTINIGDVSSGLSPYTQEDALQ